MAGSEVKVAGLLERCFGSEQALLVSPTTPLSVGVPVVRAGHRALPLRRHPERKLIPEHLGCFAPRVVMVKTTETWHRSHVCARCGLRLDCPVVGGVFVEGIVNPILMVVAHVITHEPE